MFWQEDNKEESFTVPDSVQDLSFQIKTNILPIDHKYLLKNAVLQYLPWMAKINGAIFDICPHNGNGWLQNKNDYLYPSKRSKLTLRLPVQYLNDAEKLAGNVLILGKYKIKVIKYLAAKKLSDIQILFAKSVVCDNSISEDDFLESVYNALLKINITPKKMLVGLKNTINYDNKKLITRSLMVANLTKKESVELQIHGLGDYKLLGCGVFIPHKDINDINV